MRWTVAATAALGLVGGCSKNDPADEKVAARLVGAWSRPLPVGVGEASEEILEFRADGTLVSKIGPHEKTSDWKVRGNRLILGGTAPRVIQELSDVKLRFGEGEQVTQLTRQAPAGGGQGR